MSPAPAPQVKESIAVVNAAPVTTAETVVCEVDGVSTDGNTERIDLEGTVDITLGTAATAVQLRVRRGTTNAGPQVGATVTQNGAAGNTITASIDTQDVPGDVAGQSYVLTVQQVAATGNAAVVAAALRAIIGGQ